MFKYCLWTPNHWPTVFFSGRETQHDLPYGENVSILFTKKTFFCTTVLTISLQRHHLWVPDHNKGVCQAGWRGHELPGLLPVGNVAVQEAWLGVPLCHRAQWEANKKHIETSCKTTYVLSSFTRYIAFFFQDYDPRASLFRDISLRWKS